jgi:hypothetical protein
MATQKPMPEEVRVRRKMVTHYRTRLAQIKDKIDALRNTEQEIRQLLTEEERKLRTAENAWRGGGPDVPTPQG